MVSLTDVAVPQPARGHLRPVQADRDLVQVADLVELCFKDSLDADGRSYLKQLRQAARSSPVLQWALSAAEAANGLPVSGYIWEEDGQIVGNLSLIPSYSLGQRIYLIANVAVHPNYRGRGIASMLTSTAVEFTRRRGTQAVWLQVREDNPTARHIYQRLGFVERARRTTWSSEPGAPIPPQPASDLRTGRRQAAHWPEQKKWLEELYPIELRWHLPVRWWLIRPGVWDGLHRLMSLEFPTQWSVEQDGSLLAALTSHHDGSPGGMLWLAAPPADRLDEAAVQTVLSAALRNVGRRQPLSLNLPARYAEKAVQAAGFRPQNTLLWMQIEFNPGKLY